MHGKSTGAACPEKTRSSRDRKGAARQDAKQAGVAETPEKPYSAKETRLLALRLEELKPIHSRLVHESKKED